MGKQFNIRDMPKRSDERLRQLAEWTGRTKVQIMLLGLDRLWLEENREREKMAVRLSNWIGQEGQFFERVCIVFKAMGYLPPSPDSTSVGQAPGAYASNIEAQYKADFTADEILQIIEFARIHSLDALKEMASVDGIDRELVLDERQ